MNVSIPLPELAAALARIEAKLDALAPPPRPWTVADVAKHLHVSQATVRNMAMRGDLAGVKVGKAWQFDPDTVRRFRAGG